MPWPYLIPQYYPPPNPNLYPAIHFPHGHAPHSLPRYSMYNASPGTTPPMAVSTKSSLSPTAMPFTPLQVSYRSSITAQCPSIFIYNYLVPLIKRGIIFRFFYLHLPKMDGHSQEIFVPRGNCIALFPGLTFLVWKWV